MGSRGRIGEEWDKEENGARRVFPWVAGNTLGEGTKGGRSPSRRVLALE